MMNRANEVRFRRGITIWKRGDVCYLGYDEDGNLYFEVGAQSREEPYHVRLHFDLEGAAVDDVACQCQDFTKTANTLHWHEKRGGRVPLRNLPAMNGSARCKHIWGALHEVARWPADARREKSPGSRGPGLLVCRQATVGAVAFGLRW